MFTAASVMKLVGAGHFRFLAQTSASLCSIPSPSMGSGLDDAIAPLVDSLLGPDGCQG